MGFEDLPDGWADMPLTDALLADVLDLVLSDRDRAEGALGVLVCDEDCRLLTPIVIGDLDRIPPGDDRQTGLRNLVEAITSESFHDVGKPGIHLAIARETGLSITMDDVRWRDAAVAACGADVTLLGVHVVTTEGSRRVPAQWRSGATGESPMRDAS